MVLVSNNGSPFRVAFLTAFTRMASFPDTSRCSISSTRSEGIDLSRSRCCLSHMTKSAASSAPSSVASFGIWVRDTAERPVRQWLIMLGAMNPKCAAPCSLKAEAEAAIKAELLDPASALFSEVTVDGAAVCGLVNGKNRFGGYVGAKRFVWVKGGTAQIEPSTVGLSANASGVTTCMFDSVYGDCKGDAGAPTVTECSSGLLRR